ncbi:MULTISPECIES: methylated-DNA--[protein]-cysteine S-methyltransferase [Bacillaceae]|jgi:methylated-DNA-[protein]-cysteine S-methyltransferase|uniref:methylated-DNA--[protein]-cysteine S-methyltransferase n=1 Tax=Bacillaceae TaxID=186817 RepID=UPI0004E1E241|nr:MULTISPECIES: methylated-DNA--[protein]-cysteine S-methyltransferase [Bacillaceae]MCF2650199.1 methylated-DNA--[protein]-cysteine S-methyltransferase [Niallia circulans]MCM3364440.1 methylated-DNA--[protein]-cysteine S-methyltransferase [Niallia sp. MER TA 168]CAI9396050.1 Methylated-DNA--protein-cysteine methyltransferase, constitutive [Bacillus sp. T2.9-1]
MYTIDYHSPIGVIEISGTEKAVSSILFSEKELAENLINASTPNVLVTCSKQIDDYFKGKRRDFSFPMEIGGTPFQKQVWDALTTIPYAGTGSYKDIANNIGNEKAVRAVGSANGKNKLCIVIPCHRIIGANGTLTGYAGGLWRKEWLLSHEQKFKRTI